jgi:hypothetical protein
MFGQTSTDAAPKTVAGDATLSAAGALTVTKTNGVSFGAAAIQNTGTSGATIPLLNAANTWAATQAFAGLRATSFNGLPADAPPRRGTPEYDESMAKRAQEAARPKTDQPK